MAATVASTSGSQKSMQVARACPCAVGSATSFAGSLVSGKVAGPLLAVWQAGHNIVAVMHT